MKEKLGELPREAAFWPRELVKRYGMNGAGLVCLRVEVGRGEERWEDEGEVPFGPDGLWGGWSNGKGGENE